MNKLVSAAKNLLADIATLRNPVAAAGLVGVIVELLPGVNINGQVATGIITGIAIVAGYIEHMLATDEPAPPAPPIPAPDPTPAPAPVTPVKATTKSDA